MNKIQLEAALQLAEIDCENNPNQLNKTRLAQAKAAFDAFVKGQDEPAPKPAKPAAPKKPSAPKKGKDIPVVPGATAENADASAEETDTDPDAADETDNTQADGEETEEKKTDE